MLILLATLLNSRSPRKANERFGRELPHTIISLEKMVNTCRLDRVRSELL